MSIIKDLERQEKYHIKYYIDNYIDLSDLRKNLSKLERTTIGIGFLNDPYINSNEIRNILELIKEFSFSVIIKTSSTKVLKDLDILDQINDNYAGIIFNINSLNDYEIVEDAITTIYKMNIKIGICLTTNNILLVEEIINKDKNNAISFVISDMPNKEFLEYSKKHYIPNEILIIDRNELTSQLRMFD